MRNISLYLPVSRKNILFMHACILSGMTFNLLPTNLDNLPSIDVSQLMTKEEDKSNGTHNVPVCNNDNILNKLVSRSELEALVFKAKVKQPDNLNREFILKCFLNDQSISVFEINTQTAGKFCTIHLYLHHDQC